MASRREVARDRLRKARESLANDQAVLRSSETPGARPRPGQRRPLALLLLPMRSQVLQPLPLRMCRSRAGAWVLAQVTRHSHPRTRDPLQISTAVQTPPLRGTVQTPSSNIGMQSLTMPLHSHLRRYPSRHSGCKQDQVCHHRRHHAQGPLRLRAHRFRRRVRQG